MIAYQSSSHWHAIVESHQSDSAQLDQEGEPYIFGQQIRRSICVLEQAHITGLVSQRLKAPSVRVRPANRAGRGDAHFRLSVVRTVDVHPHDPLICLRVE